MHQIATAISFGLRELLPAVKICLTLAVEFETPLSLCNRGDECQDGGTSRPHPACLAEQLQRTVELAAIGSFTRVLEQIRKFVLIAKPLLTAGGIHERLAG